MYYYKIYDKEYDEFVIFESEEKIEKDFFIEISKEEFDFYDRAMMKPQ